MHRLEGGRRKRTALTVPRRRPTLPNPRSVYFFTHRYSVYERCHAVSRFGFRIGAPSAAWAIANEAIQGDAWETYVVLGRTLLMERGIAYGRRRLVVCQANFKQ